MATYALVSGAVPADAGILTLLSSGRIADLADAFAASGVSGKIRVESYDLEAQGALNASPILQRVEEDASVGLVSFKRIRVLASGQSDASQRQIRSRMAQARQVFRDNYANWATMTAAQKDVAMRQSQRAIANLIGYVLGDEDAGD